jgi:hypothetical protein
VCTSGTARAPLLVRRPPAETPRPSARGQRFSGPRPATPPARQGWPRRIRPRQHGSRRCKPMRRLRRPMLRRGLRYLDRRWSAVRPLATAAPGGLVSAVPFRRTRTVACCPVGRWLAGLACPRDRCWSALDLARGPFMIMTTPVGSAWSRPRIPGIAALWSAGGSAARRNRPRRQATLRFGFRLHWRRHRRRERRMV